MKDCILVVGYNNTRINDVIKIREKASSSINAITVLCKDGIDNNDKKSVDFSIDVNLDKDFKNLEIIINFCKKFNLNVIGVLPFSDQGTQIGALLSEYFGLPGANSKTIGSALNKYDFRQRETILPKPDGYIKVDSKKISSLAELQSVFREFNSGVFIKPMKEGNSRGCIAIKKYEDCERAWHQIKKYLAGGISAERLIENSKEYSWDHVAGYSWLTEKTTTTTQYRAEPQHIIPAPLPKIEHDLLISGARFMAEVSGYNGCACHNEIFLLENRNEVSAVEPNLRPGGCQIWDLGSYAFEDFDPWTLWIEWAIGKIDSSPKELKMKCFAGIRFITAPQDGVIERFTVSKLTELSSMIHGDFIEFTWTKKIGDKITDCPRDNSDFIGYIKAKSDSYDSLVYSLLSAEIFLSKHGIKILPPCHIG
ncbi:MAG: biotin carboxylase [Gammaproteobacteria bacterium]